MMWPRSFYAVFGWFGRRLWFLWRYCFEKARPIVGYAFLAIGWRKSPGGDAADPARENNCELGQCEDEGSAGGQGTSDLFNNRKNEVELNYNNAAAAAADDDDGNDGGGHEFDTDKYHVGTTNEFYCEYDSTWESEENQKKTLWSFSPPVKYKFQQFVNAARDMQNYRHNYPNSLKYGPVPGSPDKPNLNFYLGLTPSSPNGVYIQDFHQTWARAYEPLECVHTYIQWLFPLQEPGMNYQASPLTKEEIECFLETTTAKENLLKSYKMMLDFYGMELCNEETGEVKRAWNYEDRFKNLNSRTHNNLRITRILKCMGTLGFPHYQAPLVRFFLEETLVNGELPNVKESVLNYFVFAVLDKKERRRLIKFAYWNYDPKYEFLWCPRKIQKVLSKEKNMCL